MSKRKGIRSLAETFAVPVTPVVNKTNWETKAQMESRWKDETEKPVRDAIEVQRQAFFEEEKTRVRILESPPRL